MAAVSPPSLVPKGRKVAPVVFGNVAPIEESTETIAGQKTRARAASEISDMIYPTPTTSPRLHPVVNVAIASINDHCRPINSFNETSEILGRVGLQVDTTADNENSMVVQQQDHQQQQQQQVGIPPLSKQSTDVASILEQDHLTWKNEPQRPRYGYLLSYQWWRNWLSTDVQKISEAPPFPSLSYEGEKESICMSPGRKNINYFKSPQSIGKIDNTPLSAQLSSKSLLTGVDGLSSLRLENDILSLIELPTSNYDFIFVPPPIWLALQHWYGGSPEIFVKIDPSAAPTAATITRRAHSNHTFGILEFTSKDFIITSPQQHDEKPENETQLTTSSSSAEKHLAHYCNVCHDLGNLRCSKCKTMYYCSQGCQGSDWPFHKQQCQKFIEPPSDSSSSAANASSTSSSQSSQSNTSSGFLSSFDWTKKISGLSQSSRSSVSSFKRQQCRGLVGLANLGNSCYLNASIQCLAHTFPLTTYLISSRYQADINSTSADSTRGKFVNEFTTLLKDMWLKPYPSGVLQPIPFRRLLGRLNTDYATFQQQDAHDVLVYLLDRLHEDLNKVQKKPYVENSEGNGENDEKISAESWEKHKLRENSYIQDVIGCQLRSQLICPAKNCQKKSVSFEFASTIQLAIPNRNRDRDRTRSNSAGLFQYKELSSGTSVLTIPIIFIPEIPIKKRGSYEPYGPSILSDFIEYPLLVTIEEDSLALVNTLRDSLQKQILKGIQRSIAKKAIENGETPPPAITGQRRVYEKGEFILIELEEAPEGPYSDSTQPCGWTTASSILNPNHRLSNVFGNSMKRNAIGERVKNESGVSESVPIAAYWRSISFGLSSNAFLLQRKIFQKISKQEDGSEIMTDVGFRLLGRPIFLSYDSKWSCARFRFTVWKQIAHLFQSHHEDLGLTVAQEKKKDKQEEGEGNEGEGKEGDNKDDKEKDGIDEDLVKQMRMANRLIIRAVDKVGNPLPKNWKERMPSPATQPTLSDIEIKENEWAASMNLPFLDLEDLSVMPALRNVSVGDFLNDRPEEISFISVDWVGGWNSLLNETACFSIKCLTNEGHITDPTPISPPVETEQPPTPPTIKNLPPPQREIPQGVISLEECLSLFTSEEILDEDNSWYCSNCQTHRQANKMIQLWRLPKVLIIGLKRFETTASPLRGHYGMEGIGNTHREKISTFVDFPINGLNISPYCNQARRRGAAEGAYPDHAYLYDLYAVINHYGRMGFGHYTAFARDWDRETSSDSASSTTSQLSSTWYSFDDDLIHLVDEKTIKTSAAYILFYRQREM